MTVSSIRFKPGIMLDNTPLASTGGYVSAQWVRFRRLGGEDISLPECMPGWESITDQTLSGVARGSHAWLDQSGQPLFATATHDTVYAYVGGDLRDITPSWGQFFLTDPLTTESGTATVTVSFNVYDPDSGTSVVAPHGLIPGDVVTLSHVDAIGGITCNGPYTITDVPTLTTFQFEHTSNASSTATMSGASKVWLDVAYRAGLVDGTGGTGYGTGTYGTGLYGLPTIGDYQPRINSFDSLGDRLYFVPRGGPLFGFQPRNSYDELLANSTFAASAGWALGTGWSIGAGVATAVAGVASNLSQSIADRVEGGAVYRVTITIAPSAGSGYIGINAGDPAAVVRLSPDISKAGTWELTLQSPADPLDIVFSKGSAFAGTVSLFSQKVEPLCYRINEAPIASDSMFVDQRGIIILNATYQADGVFNPNCIRSSGIDNEREWIPDTDSIASEYILTKGGRVVGGRASRNAVAVWTDDAFFTGAYTGTPGVAYDFKLSGTGSGLISPLASAEHAGFVFWMSPAGQFWSVSYDFQGARPIPIECSGRKAVFDNISPSQAGKIFAVSNTENNEIWFSYPSTETDPENVENDRAALFSISEGVWSFTALDRSTAVKSGVFAYPIMVSPSGSIFFHEKGDTANGEPLESWIVTAPFGVGEADTLMDFFRFIPDFKDQVGVMSFTLYGQDHPRSTGFERPARTITPTTQVVDDRVCARRLWFKLYANASPSAWRFGGLQIDGKPKQARRFGG